MNDSQNQNSANNGVGSTGGSASVWIAVTDRLPTQNDANEFGEVWWWLPRFASHGAQCDYWNFPDGATHWMPCDGYEAGDEQPSPPNVGG